MINSWKSMEALTMYSFVGSAIKPWMRTKKSVRIAGRLNPLRKSEYDLKDSYLSEGDL